MPVSYTHLDVYKRQVSHGCAIRALLCRAQGLPLEALNTCLLYTSCETIRYAREKGLFVITDGKRNDIGTTMQAYAAAHLGAVSIEGKEQIPFGGDALTVNAYLGSDGIRPLIEICNQQDKGIFALVKTRCV